MIDSSKPVLVTGATGSIGSALVISLVKSGFRVRALVRDPERATSLQDNPNIELSTGDLSQPDSLRGCTIGCSLVYHMAARLFGSDWAKSSAVNVTGTQAILDEVAQAGVDRFVYTSTIGVYGLSKADTITEETPLPKFDYPYFATKHQAERVVQSRMGELPITIARLGDVFGPGQLAWTINLIQQMKAGLLPLPLPSESGFVNPIYIENLIDALLLLGIHSAASGQIFNVVDGFPIRSDEFFRAYYQMAGKQPKSLPAWMMKAGNSLLLVMDHLNGRETSVTPGSVQYLYRKGKIYPKKMHDLLGWSPSVSQEEAFRRTEAWLRQEGYLP